MPLTVEKIENGTVIDHITAGKGLRVLDILGIRAGFEGRAALVMNVPSKKMGRKDIVKVEGRFLDEKDVDKIAVIAPQATLNIIKGGEVKEKGSVKLPRAIAGVFRCPNPKCITNFERIPSRFNVERGPRMRCAYCERMFAPDEPIVRGRAKAASGGPPLQGWRPRACGLSAACFSRKTTHAPRESRAKKSGQAFWGWASPAGAVGVGEGLGGVILPAGCGGCSGAAVAGGVTFAGAGPPGGVAFCVGCCWGGSDGMVMGWPPWPGASPVGTSSPFPRRLIASVALLNALVMLHVFSASLAASMSAAAAEHAVPVQERSASSACAIFDRMLLSDVSGLCVMVKVKLFS